MFLVLSVSLLQAVNLTTNVNVCWFRTTTLPSSKPRVKSPEKSKPRSSSSNKELSGPEVVKLPLRERLVHLLAVQPYTKSELLLRLNKEGMGEEERIFLSIAGQIDQLLRQALSRNIWQGIECY